MSKLIDIYNNNLKDGRVPMFSFEYFPPKTDKGVEILYERLDRMGFLGPSWIDVTWGAGGSTSTLTQEICKNTQNFVGLDTLMHMTCTNISRDQIKEELKIAQENGIKNILALRGGFSFLFFLKKIQTEQKKIRQGEKNGNKLKEVFLMLLI